MDLEQIKKRQEELQLTLKNLAEIIEIRNHLLMCFEKQAVILTSAGKFTSVKNKKNNIDNLCKKTAQLELKMNRRNLFYLQKRKRRLEEELIDINNRLQETKNSEAAQEDLSQSS